MPILKLATRQSQLALWQANFVKAQLEALHANVKVELVPLLTEGDQILDRPLADFGGKGLFIKKLEQALLQKAADFAVHSMKDVPPQLESSFCLAAILQRAAPNDVLVSHKYARLQELPAAAIVGTSSVRRAAQIKNLRPDLHTQLIRGNIDTRLRKLIEGPYDALILAEAGLQRLGLANQIKEIFPIERMLPSVGQGALGIECLAENKAVHELLRGLNHADTEACLQAERTMLAHLGAHCNSPVGCFASKEQELIMLQTAVFSKEGDKKIIAAAEHSDPKQLGIKVAEDLIKQGAKFLFAC